MRSLRQRLLLEEHSGQTCEAALQGEQPGQQVDARQSERVQVRVHQAQQLQEVLQDGGAVQAAHEDVCNKGLPDKVCNSIQVVDLEKTGYTVLFLD